MEMLEDIFGASSLAWHCVTVISKIQFQLPKLDTEWPEKNILMQSNDKSHNKNV